MIERVNEDLKRSTHVVRIRPECGELLTTGPRRRAMLLSAVGPPERRPQVRGGCPRARSVLRGFAPLWDLPAAGVQMIYAATPDARARRDEARAILKDEPAVRFAGRVLQDDAQKPVLYTENFFVKFDPEESPEKCAAILADYQLVIKRPLTYARNAFFVQAQEGTGQAVFEIAEAMLKHDAVQLCHPELVRPVRERGAFRSSGTSPRRPSTDSLSTRTRTSSTRGR